MKLAKFSIDNTISFGLVTQDGIIDFKKINLPYSDLESLIWAGNDALAFVQQSCTGVSAHYSLSDVTFLAPISRPGKFLAIGMNYKKHQEEADKLGVEKRSHQTWFNKQITCINDPFGDIHPGVTEKLDYEVELGIIIGKKSKYLTIENVRDSIFGYVVVNDVSARDWQFHTPTFTMGKSFDTHGPIGPWIVTADEIEDPQNLELRCYVNGELRQENNTSEMIHNINDQLIYLSNAFTLEPCDIIATGTPEGVGVAMEPPVFLKEGDLVTCEIEHIGSIRNKVTR
ncbi:MULTISPECIES: fumarylacetoacetate hydrolase family protein [unclassified Acinetobacter]|uniref:fumarylacetoacetate hydrolase family protein n=1 Tax=unclassified Acinetobacter TaxID=196816 RepID=UPI001909E179|nr:MULTISPECIES: fumarylacetoacetate hydrolase family protein [unclassified Acinetobacter]MBK0062548.1 fumarylacetoacetate hydrolase family protein [Acinetobacter sp. S55]MBK0066352.1 fumarylacetoacetate hydrolase family protein [Acinetobacter sp. S54]